MVRCRVHVITGMSADADHHRQLLLSAHDVTLYQAIVAEESVSQLPVEPVVPPTDRPPPLASFVLSNPICLAISS